MRRPPAPTFGADPAVGRWIGPRLTGGWGRVTGAVPPLVQWTRIGLRRHRHRHRHPTWDGRSPREGNLDPVDLGHLVDQLRPHTGTPESCWFGLWEGYSFITGAAALDAFVDDGSVVHRELPPAFTDELLADDRLLRLPGRDYLLGHGPVDSALGVGQQVDADRVNPPRKPAR